jgi:FKBP-type peptidyl-prolyl cis-trans isomerase FkpA
MKKTLLLLLFPLFALTGCLKNNTPACNPETINAKAPDTEISGLKGVLSGLGILSSFTEDPRGLFYSFSTTGTGAKPTTCSVVRVDYEARLLSGTRVDSGTNVNYQVRAFILGWQEILPLMPVGSTVNVYVPPSLAYGNVTAGPIPANSNLQFIITLKGIQ